MFRAKSQRIVCINYEYLCKHLKSEREKLWCGDAEHAEQKYTIYIGENKKITEVVKKYFFLIGNGIKMFRSSAP